MIDGRDGFGPVKAASLGLEEGVAVVVDAP
jgi:hypothetical protein